MPKLILPKSDLKEFLRKRRRFGGDRFDEVWNGVYVVSPDADNEHQRITSSLMFEIISKIGNREDVSVLPGANVSDQAEKWTKNYRVPDIAVFLPGNPALDQGAYWLGGPDFAVEILSRGDRSRKKFAFYAKVGVRELMLVDRRPWGVELYRRQGDRFDLVGRSDLETAMVLASDVLPLTFRLLPGDPRPQIEVSRADGTERWLA